MTKRKRDYQGLSWAMFRTYITKLDRVESDIAATQTALVDLNERLAADTHTAAILEAQAEAICKVLGYDHVEEARLDIASHTEPAVKLDPATAQAAVEQVMGETRPGTAHLHHGDFDTVEESDGTRHDLPVDEAAPEAAE